MSDPPSIAIPSLASSLLAACVLNWGLLGILTVQTYLYYAAFPKDRRAAKVLVYGIFLCELIQTIITTLDIYAAFVNGFGKYEALDGIHTYWLTIPVSGGVAGCAGQVFFAYRISKLQASGARVIPIFIVTLAMISGCASLVAAQQFHHAGSFSALNNNTLIAVGIWNGLGGLCDVIIAIFMPYFLLREGTGLSETHDLITNLLRLSLETGFLTALFAITHLIFYFVRSNSSVAFIVFGVTIPKIYANVILVLLNNRMEISHGRDASFRSEQAAALGSLAEVPSPSRIFVDNDRMTVRLDDFPRANVMTSNTMPSSKSLKPRSSVEFRTTSSQNSVTSEIQGA